MNVQNHDITKRPAVEPFWVCLQRYLQFDDPESKWERLLQLAIKHSTKQRIKLKQAERLPLCEQQMHFSQTFGAATEPAARASTVFNVLLGLQDLDMFAPVSFDAWFAAHDKPTDLSEQDSADPLKTAVLRLSETRNLSASKRAWLLHCAAAVPDWQILLDDGPWSADHTRAFIVDFFNEAKLDSISDEAGLMRAYADFNTKLTAKRATFRLPAQFIPRLILLVEGATETILMPHFARLLGCEFDARGILIVGTGGANQTSRKYLVLRDMTNVPIYSLLDADATEQVEVISDMLRDNDGLHVWTAGDIEDTFATEVLIPQLNHYVQSKGAEPVALSEVPDGERRTLVLDRAFRKRGLGNFDKIGFAKSISERLTEPAAIPKEAAVVINDICKLARGK